MTMDGVLVIVVGVLVATWSMFVGSKKGEWLDSYKSYRHRLGRAILLGLEFLVAADIIRTVAVAPTLSNVGVLGLIVLIRTFLSWAIEFEMEGRLPWQEKPRS